MSDSHSFIQQISTTVSIISIMAGVAFSALSYKNAKIKEAESKKIEAAKPFLELRQKLYLDALGAASVLATKEHHSKEEIELATKRFLELFWGELSLVEEKGIEKHMIAIAVAEGLFDTPTETQNATYDLAHVMRESLKNSWNIDTTFIGSVNK